MNTRAPSLSTLLSEAISRDAEEWIELPLLAGITSGELEQSLFRNYLEQDYLYLRYYARLYSHLAASATDEAQLEHFVRLAYGVIDVEIASHQRLAEPFGCSFDNVEPSSETSAYLGFYDSLRDDREAMLVAMTPCILGYSVALAPVRAQASPGPYRDWLDVYAGGDYTAMIADHLAALDELTIPEDRALELTQHALRLERQFWNQTPRKVGA